MKNQQTSRQMTIAFILVTSLFFLWGFAHNLDPILIPHLKRSFLLTTAQSTLVDSSVYIAYFLMALPAGLLMKKFGHKKGIVVGLFTFAVGAFLFIPAADFQSYTFFLVALFIIACGLTILETIANPYISELGPEKSSIQRLNLAQSFNGLAAALAPVIGSRIILIKGISDEELTALSDPERKIALAAEASTVKEPYFILGLLLVIMAIIFSTIKLPESQRAGKPIRHKRESIFSALKNHNLRWAVVSQFFYVGAQVSVFSLFILYATHVVAITEITAADLLAACGIAFLLGRFLGTFFMKYIAPHRLLGLYAIANIFLSAFAMYATGMIAVYTIILICFFMSIMFPTIFAMGINELKADREYGSSLLVMSIVGGAILPGFFGLISDFSGNIQIGYIVPLISFLVIAYFALYKYKTV